MPDDRNPYTGEPRQWWEPLDKLREEFDDFVNETRAQWAAEASELARIEAKQDVTNGRITAIERKQIFQEGRDAEKRARGVWDRVILVVLVGAAVGVAEVLVRVWQ